jgi:hypothetical protein
MRYVPYLYFLRIPLIFAVIVAVVPMIGLWIGRAPNPILGGFFDLSSSGVFIVCLEGFLYPLFYVSPPCRACAFFTHHRDRVNDKGLLLCALKSSIAFQPNPQ